MDGVQLQKFDSLVSLKRTDGSDITPASLYNYLRDTFNDYFAQDGAGNVSFIDSPTPAESPAGARSESPCSTLTLLCWCS